MTHDFSSKIRWLETQWTPPEGVLGQLRYGKLDWKKAEMLIDTLLSWDEQIPLEEPLPPRFVALLWSVPTYIENHRPILESSGADSARLSEFSGKAVHAVSAILGLP